MYHRITVDPCSLTVVRYGERRPFVRRLNDTGGDVADLLPPPPSPSPTGASPAGGDGSTPGAPPAQHQDEHAPDRHVQDEAVGGGAGVWSPPPGSAGSG